MFNIKTKRAFAMFFLAALFYFYEYCLQISPSVMTMDLMRDLHIGAIGLGTLMSFFFYPYALLQIPAGLLYDRFSCRSLLTFTTLLCALGAVVFAWANHIGWACLGRLLMGTGAAFSFLGIIVLVAQWFPQRWYATFIGLAQLLGALGAIAGEELFAHLLVHMNWSEVILNTGWLGLVLAGLIAWIVRDNPNPSATQVSDDPIGKQLWNILTHAQTLGIGFYTFFLWGPITSFAALWGVPFIQAAYQISLVKAANVCTFLWLGCALGSPLVGYLSDWYGRRKPWLIVCALLGIVSSMMIIYVPWSNWTVLVIWFFIFGFATSGQALSFAFLRDCMQHKTIGAASGFNNMATVAGGSILPILIGWLIWFHWDNQLIAGLPVYQISDYRFALLVIPLCHVAAWLIAAFILKEPECNL